MAQTSRSVGQSAKDYAKSQLGDLDLSYLDKERDAARNTYNTSKTSLENSFNNLLNQINSNRADSRKNFNTGRSTIAEKAFDANLNNQLNLSSKVAGTSGLKKIGEMGNRIETGRQYSDLANKFYKDMGELDIQEKQGREQYTTDSQKLQNNLDLTLAGIDSRGAEAQRNYNNLLAQLAEGVQSRWDNNANAEKALAQAKAAAAQAHNDALNASRQNLQALKRQELDSIVNMKDANGNPASNETMLSRIQTSFGVDRNFAEKVLQELGIIESPIGPTQDGGNLSIKGNTDYLSQILGGWY